MAFTLLQRKKMQQGLILVLIAVLFITATVLWLGFFQKGPSLAGPQGTMRPALQQIEINFNVLSLPLLQELNAPAEPVLEPLIKGRNNPFLPF
ncbi:MAG: hypothetical protein Q7S62_01545 [bacterium]|nr:hypothetical protein [bacterium]